MYHSNDSYKHDLDAVSPDDLSSNPQQSSSSSGHIQRLSDQPLISLNPELYNISRIAIDENHPTYGSLEQRVSTTEDECALLLDRDSYYSIKYLQKRRRGERKEDSALSQHVKQFYKDQDELIDAYERMHKQETDNGKENDKVAKQQESMKRMTNILTKVSFGVNICLFILKVVGAIISNSLSVISSVIDSAIDLATSVILLWASHAIRKRDKYRYPQGRTRLEPLAIIILAVIMCAASLLVIYDSISTVTSDVQYFTQTNTTRTLAEINMSALPVTAMVITVVVKSILFVLCYRIKTPTMYALASDHRNDVASNIVALICGLIGSFAYKNTINQKAIVIDPVGAIIISIYIIITWIRQANGQVKRLSGHSADRKFLSRIMWLTYHHSPLIMKIDTVRAFYFSTLYLVQVIIVLPKDMFVQEARDIAESLQEKIEDLPEVELAFVHITYECSHNPTIEHKVG